MGCASSSASDLHRNIIPERGQNDDQPDLTDASLCRTHGGKILTKYSEKDNKLYCKLCIANKRNLNTHIKEIKDYVQTLTFKQKLIKTDNDIRSKKREIQSLLSDVNDNMSALEAQKNNLVDEISNFKSAVIDIIKYLCDELNDRVMSIYDQERKTLDKRNDDIMAYLRNMNPQESNCALVKNPDAVRLLKVIEMERALSSLSSQVHDKTFVDIQLKLHENISLRKLLNCDQTASTLGEVFVLRNARSARPCTKDLIVHDKSDIDDASETDATLSDNNDKHIEDRVNTPLAMKRVSSLSRTLNMKPTSKGKLTTEVEIESNENKNKTDVSQKPKPLANDTADCKKPILSDTPRFEQKNRQSRNSNTKSQIRVKADRESISRVSQSIQSNFSIMTPSSIQFGTPLNEKKFFERKAVLIKTVTLSGSNLDCDISSSVILPNGNVILCDKRNRKLVYLDDTFYHISDIGFDHEPNSICVINDKTHSDEMSDPKVAVTFPKARRIQIVNVNSDSLVKVDEIRTEPECWGIGCKGKALVFSTESGDVFRDVGDYRNYRWRKYRYSFQKPVFLTVNKENLYVCSWGLDEVSGSLVAMHFDDRGKDQIQFSYSNKFLRRPICCSIDCEENIYICDGESEGIHQVSPDGSQYRILDVNGGQKGQWQHINFVPNSDYFILTGTGSNTLNVFQMK